MITRQYVATVQHDEGFIRIRTAARNKKVARDLIMKFEGCPARAIKSVECVRP